MCRLHPHDSVVVRNKCDFGIGRDVSVGCNCNYVTSGVLDYRTVIHFGDTVAVSVVSDVAAETEGGGGVCCALAVLPYCSFGDIF